MAETTGDLDLALRVRADVKDALRNLDRLKDEVKRSGQAVAQSNSRQAESAREAARTARELSQARARANREETEGARAALSLAEANDRAARETLRLTRADTAAATAGQRAARTALQVAGSMDRQAVSANRAAAATRRSAGAFRPYRHAVQNVAFQVQDFAVQVAAGTSAARAFGQQAPQLLGGFGPLGAVIGAVLAVAVPLAAVFFNLGEATERLAEATERLRALRDLGDDLGALAEKYGPPPPRRAG